MTIAKLWASPQEVCFYLNMKKGENSPFSFATWWNTVISFQLCFLLLDKWWRAIPGVMGHLTMNHINKSWNHKACCCLTAHLNSVLPKQEWSDCVQELDRLNDLFLSISKSNPYLSSQFQSDWQLWVHPILSDMIGWTSDALQLNDSHVAKLVGFLWQSLLSMLLSLIHDDSLQKSLSVW